MALWSAVGSLINVLLLFFFLLLLLFFVVLGLRGSMTHDMATLKADITDIGTLLLLLGCVFAMEY